MVIYNLKIGNVKKKKGAFVIEVSLNPSIYFDANAIPNDYDKFSTFTKAKSEVLRQLKRDVSEYNSVIRYVQSLKVPNS